MLREVWLRPNRRLFAVCLLLLAAIAGASVVVAFAPWASALRVGGVVLLALALAGMAACVYGWYQPRLAVADHELLVYLRPGAPLRVPLEQVEGFLLQRAASGLPGRFGRRQAQALVIRLSERWERLQQSPLRSPLGMWCGHYITIYGAWCEPLSVALAQRLNERLDSARRATVKVRA